MNNKIRYAYDGEFVHEIQKRHNWPWYVGVGPFRKELEGRVAIRIPAGITSGTMLVPRPEYESLPDEIKAKLGPPKQALDDTREQVEATDAISAAPLWVDDED
jgi:hypothetical protein